jgi:hypothetical protein
MNLCTVKQASNLQHWLTEDINDEAQKEPLRPFTSAFCATMPSGQNRRCTRSHAYVARIGTISLTRTKYSHQQNRARAPVPSNQITTAAVNDQAANISKSAIGTLSKAARLGRHASEPAKTRQMSRRQAYKCANMLERPRRSKGVPCHILCSQSVTSPSAALDPTNPL